MEVESRGVEVTEVFRGIKGELEDGGIDQERISRRVLSISGVVCERRRRSSPNGGRRCPGRSFSSTSLTLPVTYLVSAILLVRTRRINSRYTFPTETWLTFPRSSSFFIVFHVSAWTSENTKGEEERINRTSWRWTFARFNATAEFSAMNILRGRGSRGVL